MENNSINLPTFEAQPWIKMKDQTVQEFHDSVHEHVKALIQRGYDVEIEWINSKGEICDNESDMSVSVLCRIVEKKEKLKESWMAEVIRQAKGIKEQDDER